MISLQANQFWRLPGDSNPKEIRWQEIWATATIAYGVGPSNQQDFKNETWGLGYIDLGCVW